MLGSMPDAPAADELGRCPVQGRSDRVGRETLGLKRRRCEATLAAAPQPSLTQGCAQHESAGEVMLGLDAFGDDFRAGLLRIGADRARDSHRGRVLDRT